MERWSRDSLWFEIRLNSTRTPRKWYSIAHTHSIFCFLSYPLTPFNRSFSCGRSAFLTCFRYVMQNLLKSSFAATPHTYSGMKHRGRGVNWKIYEVKKPKSPPVLLDPLQFLYNPKHIPLINFSCKSPSLPPTLRTIPSIPLWWRSWVSHQWPSWCLLSCYHCWRLGRKWESTKAGGARKMTKNIR